MSIQVCVKNINEEAAPPSIAPASWLTKCRKLNMILGMCAENGGAGPPRLTDWLRAAGLEPLLRPQVQDSER